VPQISARREKQTNKRVWRILRKYGALPVRKWEGFKGENDPVKNSGFHIKSIRMNTITKIFTGHFFR
jgi:hypothetical protein